MYVWQRWMAVEFRAAGLTVREVEGWKNRGRPATTGGYQPNAGLLDHHTGTTTSDDNPHPTLQMLIKGRPDLPGPLAPWSVDYDGVVWVIAAGRCNHAGRTNKPFAGVAAGSDGNYHFMGDEVDTNGTQKLPPKQRRSIARHERRVPRPHAPSVDGAGTARGHHHPEVGHRKHQHRDAAQRRRGLPQGG